MRQRACGDLHGAWGGAPGNRRFCRNSGSGKRETRDEQIGTGPADGLADGVAPGCGGTGARGRDGGVAHGHGIGFRVKRPGLKEAAMETGDGIRDGWDGVRAWRFIRASKGYRKAWKRRIPPPGLPERAPFPVRLQTAVDLAALEWGMHAWENPYAEDGPPTPFWARAGMPDSMVAPDGLPLAALAATGHASLSGLRLGDGALILRIERNGAAAHIRIPGGGAFPENGGLLLVREVLRIEDVWSDLPAPSPGRGRGTGTASFCWRWRARPKGGRTGTPPRPSGTGTVSRRNTTPTAGCTRASSAG